MKQKFLAASVAVALAAPAAAFAQSEEGASPVDFDFYGSIRVQGEYVKPDDETVEDDYFGFRDAYSRIGATASYDAGAVTIFGKVESGLDVANFRIQGPYEQNETGAHEEDQLWEHLRVAKVGIKGDFGTLAVGQDWLPYYNAIAYPVDMFSTYYSGFATYTSFRRNKLVSYYSPDFAGFSFSAGYINEGGYMDTDGDPDDRYQATASYNFGNTTVSAGMDNAGGASDTTIYGLSLMHTIENVGDGSVYIGAKAEQITSDFDGDAFGNDGDVVMNLFGSYTVGKHTIKGMVADVEHYGENVLHLGYDYQLMDSLKLFAEYYYEEETAAITERRGGAAETLWAAGGGQTASVGFRYDF
jgi:hypothetical protein